MSNAVFRYLIRQSLIDVTRNIKDKKPLYRVTHFAIQDMHPDNPLITEVLLGRVLTGHRTLMF